MTDAGRSRSGSIAAARATGSARPTTTRRASRGVGCDCLGLVRGVWRELYGAEPMPIPPYSRDWGETGAREPLAEAARRVMIELPTTGLAPGALILFRMRAGRRRQALRHLSPRPTASSTPTSAAAWSRRRSTPPGAGASPSRSCSRRPESSGHLRQESVDRCEHLGDASRRVLDVRRGQLTSRAPGPDRSDAARGGQDHEAVVLERSAAAGALKSASRAIGSGKRRA